VLTLGSTAIYAAQTSVRSGINTSANISARFRGLPAQTAMRATSTRMKMKLRLSGMRPRPRNRSIGVDMEDLVVRIGRRVRMARDDGGSWLWNGVWSGPLRGSIEEG
jgi:hypothetical protein